MSNEIKKQRAMEALTSGGAALVLLAPVPHGHVWVYLPCKYRLIRLMSISRTTQGKPRTCVVVVINVLSGFDGRCAVEYSPRKSLPEYTVNIQVARYS
jgi:hypothetical protein